MRYRYKCIDNNEILNNLKKDSNYKSWYKIVRKILKNKEFQKRRLFNHHKNESLWTHSIKVSFYSYKFALEHNINAYNCAIAGLLHDFYTRAWQDGIELTTLDNKYRDRFINPKKEKLLEKHAFTHPIEALVNSKKYFKKYLNKNIENAIVTHMFPLSIITKNKYPNCIESYVITYIDKKVSLNILIPDKNIITTYQIIKSTRYTKY